MPGIKNFTSDVAVEKTVGECIGFLARRGVRQVATLYDVHGKPEGLSFTMQTEYGMRDFRLPVRVEGVLAALLHDANVPRNRKTRQQAERTAWRIAKDFLEAQSALIDAGLATIDEVMMPYQVTNTGETLYSLLRGRWMKEIES